MRSYSDLKKKKKILSPLELYEMPGKKSELGFEERGRNEYKD